MTSQIGVISENNKSSSCEVEIYFCHNYLGSRSFNSNLCLVGIAHDMEDECDLAAPQVEGGERSLTSGHAKRRRRSQLPRVFFMQDEDGYISGAMRVSECAYLDAQPDILHWSVDLDVSFAAQVDLEEGDLQRWHGKFLELSSDAEVLIRKLDVTAGGVANDHFIEQAHGRWWVWPSDQPSLEK